MQINLSDATKITIDAINAQLYLTLYDIMTGTIRKDIFKKLIKKRLKIPENSIEFIKKNRDLIVKLENNSNILAENSVTESFLLDEISTILSHHLSSNLKNKITGRPLYYITKGSKIPLMGSIYFGIIDRGTNLIQVRPAAGFCPLNCPFCSVDEGPRSKTRFTDYIIDVSYLIEETKKIIDYKAISDIELHIDGQSEPTLYPHLPELITEFSKDSRITRITMQTNGVPLNHEYIKQLERVGLNRINLSINSLNPKKARYLAGTSTYNVDHVKQVAKDIVNSNIQLLVAPLWVPGINDDDIEEIISFAINLNIKSDFPILGIQNYLKYRFGRKMKNIKMVNMKKFREQLHKWEENFEIPSLYLSPGDFGMHPAKRYPKTLRKGEKTEVEIVIPGRISSKYKNRREMLGKAEDRIIQIMNSTAKIGDKLKVKISNTKDNIYYGRELNN